MAIKGLEEENKSNMNNIDLSRANISNESARAAQPQRESTGMGFNSDSFYTMKSSKGSEYTMAAVRAIVEQYKALPENLTCKVTVLDKEIFTKLAYSVIVVSYLSNGIVYYYTVLLEATGPKALTAREIMSEIETSNNRQYANVPALIYTPDEAIDRILHDEIINALRASYNDVKFVSVEGVVIHAGATDIVVSMENIAGIAFNACYVESIISKDIGRDFSIGMSRKEAGNLRVESNVNPQTVKNEVETPVRSDFMLSLTHMQSGSEIRSLNADTGKLVLAKVTGFVDAIPFIETIAPNIMGGQPYTVTRFRPQIVITSIGSNKPTVGYSVLSLITGLIMANKDMYFKALVNNEKIGSLNLFANISNEQEPVALDYKSKKYTNDQKLVGIRQMFTKDPEVSLDIESFGPNAYQLSIWAAAASPIESKNKHHAAKELISIINHLTDGNFPLDYPINEIFATNGIVVPLGVWHDKSGERDIRDIDLAFVGTQTNGDLSMMDAWALSALPKEATNKDPYITRVDIISKLIPDAVINSKAIRVTFKPRFIATLNAAAEASGLVARYDREITLADVSNLSIMNNYYGGEGFAGASFARHAQGAQGYNPNTGYGNMGNGRYN